MQISKQAQREQVAEIVRNYEENKGFFLHPAVAKAIYSQDIATLSRQLESEDKRIRGDAFEIVRDLVLAAKRNVIPAEFARSLPQLVPQLMTGLKTSIFEEVCPVLSALENLGDHSVVPELLRILREENSYYFDGIADVAAKLGGASTIPELEELLHHPKAVIRESAARALAKTIKHPGNHYLYSEMQEEDNPFDV